MVSVSPPPSHAIVHNEEKNQNENLNPHSEGQKLANDTNHLEKNVNSTQREIISPATNKQDNEPTANANAIVTTAPTAPTTTNVVVKKANFNFNNNNFLVKNETPESQEKGYRIDL